MSKISPLRWLGGLALMGAMLLLLIGEIWLKPRLTPLLSLLFWLICFGLTVLAMLVALIEIRAIRLKSRQVQKELVQATLNQIASEACQTIQPNSTIQAEPKKGL